MYCFAFSCKCELVSASLTSSNFHSFWWSIKNTNLKSEFTHFLSWNQGLFYVYLSQTFFLVLHRGLIEIRSDLMSNFPTNKKRSSWSVVASLYLIIIDFKKSCAAGHKVECLDSKALDWKGLNESSVIIGAACGGALLHFFWFKMSCFQVSTVAPLLWMCMMAVTSATARTWLWFPWITVLVPLAFLLCMAPLRLLEMLVCSIRGWRYSGFKTTFTSLVETLNKLVLHVQNEESSYFNVKSQFWDLFLFFK